MCYIYGMGGKFSCKFQRPFDGSVDFFLGWDDYEKGFGNVWGEYWLGLQQIHRLTNSGRWTLRIDMEDFHESAVVQKLKFDDVILVYSIRLKRF